VRPRASRARPGRGFFRRPRGFVDEPQPATEHRRGPIHVRGWFLFPGSTVARVELRLNGGPPQLARLALERQDVAGYTAQPTAPICGWEHAADLGELPEDVSSVRIEAAAHAVDGRTLRLTPVEVEIAAEPQHSAYGDGSAAQLRQRSLRPLRAHAASPSAGGLRLLAYTHVLVHGGGSLYLLELLGRLVEARGVSCEVVALDDGPLRHELEELGIPVHVTDAAALASVERYEGHLAELVAWAAPLGFDAVLANTLSSFPGGDLAERLGIPAVWAVHESYTLPMFWHAAYPPGAVHPYVRERGAHGLWRATAVLFEAEATRRLFLRDADPERLVALPYGIELGAIDTARRALDRAATRTRLGLDPDAEVVLCLGTIERRKSQAMLAKAFALVADRYPRAQLVLVGESGDRSREGYQSALRDYVCRAGLEDRVRIEPVTDDAYRWHVVADLLVCASDVESLPRVILEAMAFGTPVLSTSVFGVPELIEDGRTGYLCGMRDVDELTTGLERALGAGAAERSAIAKAASERVREHHDPAAYALQVERLLRGAVADRDALPAEWLDPPDAVEERRGVHSGR
jgi:D-inositol-3-phosphate glycosyltransferase